MMEAKIRWVCNYLDSFSKCEEKY